jgi:TfoX/Sxy family transcriptional regulator of competence genes
MLTRKHIKFEAKKMMGGLCYMINDKMTVGVMKEDLMVRVGQDQYAGALKKKGCRVMDFTGRPLKGFEYVNNKGIDLDDDLESWIDVAMAFNKVAKKSKKKSSKK